MEFVRWVYLDLTGKIPSIAKMRRCFADKTPNKQELLVDQLLESSGYISTFTTKWEQTLIPEATSNSATAISFAFILLLASEEVFR